MECPHRQPAFRPKKYSELETDCIHNIPTKHQAGFCSRPEYYRCIEDVKRMIVPLSYSSVQNFLTCHRLYYLRNIRGIETLPSQTSNALKLGRLWDSCLQYYLGKKDSNLNDLIEELGMDAYEVGKVRGLYRAMRDLGLTVDPGYELQKRFDYRVRVYPDPSHPLADLTVTGFYDRYYPNYFVENKLSGRPDSYFDLFFLQSQIGTYFLVDEKLEYCLMEVVRTPDLRRKRSGSEEQPDEFERRVYEDVLGRPGYYFIGYDKERRVYGKKFHRGEFDLDEIRDRFKHVVREVHEASFADGFYKNDRVCNGVLPGIPCDLLGVCRYNTMSESVYRIRQKNIE